MRTWLLGVGFFASLVMPAQASSPGMIEGPPGCRWDAVITQALADRLELRLVKKLGACMAESGPCGKDGDIVTAGMRGSDPAHRPGVTLQIWTDEHGARLQPPECTRTPIDQ